jgi:3-deoxy-manno-octulosonate cytidylyltransferase (CMP-KDO synthetase)
MDLNKFKILDCTLRDGGYYTDWNFSSTLVKNLVKTLDENNTDIIELGYKSPLKGGPYRKCNDGFIFSIIDFPVKASLAFMIDVKDYISDDKVNVSLLKDIIKPSNIFSICRIAAKYDEIKYIPELTNIIKELGYDVICNLMAVSKSTPEELLEFYQLTKKLDLLAIYVADSYGALTPLNVKNIFTPKTRFSGIHTHDNMGLAFANCLEAISCGATYIDGTLLGMGRGVGNVRTEQLLLYRDNITPSLLDCVDEFEKLKSQYKWGHNSLYMKAGKEHIHPLYLQDLNQSNLTNKELLNVLDTLSECSSYDKDKLKKLTQQRAVVVIPARYKSSRFPGKPLAMIKGKEMIFHVAEKAELAVGKENVYIATENEEIALLVKQKGYNVVLTSDNCLTGTDRVAEASKEIQADIFVNVQGDEPMIDPNDITKAITLKQQFPDYVINCMSKFHYNESVEDKKIPKIVCDLNDNLLYSSRSPVPGNKNGLTKDAMKQVCIYVFNKDHLDAFYSENKTPLEAQEDIEIIRFLEKNIPVKMMEITQVSYAVDYPEDIQTIEQML